MQRSRPQFGLEIIDVLAANVDAAAAVQHDRLRALAKCVNNLDDGSRDLLRVCYAKGAKIRDVAQQVGRSIDGVYKVLSRLRKALHDCVERKMQEEEAE